MAANPNSPSGGTSELSNLSWQEKLEDHCRSIGASPPTYDILSDRRGGRTAWSAIANIASLGQKFQARFWYDGQWINNAREDAAEVGIKWFQNIPQAGTPAGAGPSGPSTTGPGSGGGLQLRGGAGSAFNANGLLPSFSSTSRHGHASGYGIVWPATSSRK